MQTRPITSSIFNAASSIRDERHFKAFWLWGNRCRINSFNSQGSLLLVIIIIIEMKLLIVKSSLYTRLSVFSELY